MKRTIWGVTIFLGSYCLPAFAGEVFRLTVVNHTPTPFRVITAGEELIGYVDREGNTLLEVPFVPSRPSFMAVFRGKDGLDAAVYRREVGQPHCDSQLYYTQCIFSDLGKMHATVTILP